MCGSWHIYCVENTIHNASIKTFFVIWEDFWWGWDWDSQNGESDLFVKDVIDQCEDGDDVIMIQMAG